MRKTVRGCAGAWAAVVVVLALGCARSDLGPPSAPPGAPVSVGVVDFGGGAHQGTTGDGGPLTLAWRPGVTIDPGHVSFDVSGLIGAWHMDEQTVTADGTRIADGSSAAHHGVWRTDDAGRQSSGPGKLGRALHFDLYRDFVEVAPTPALATPPELSLAAWVWVAGAGVSGCGTVASKGNEHWSLRFDASGSTQLAFFVGFAGDDLYLETVDWVPLHRWVHLAVTWDGTPQAAGAHVFVDGVEASYDVAVDATGARNDDADATLFLGWELNGLDYCYWDGALDEVLLFDRALAAAEIQTLYALQRDGLFATTPATYVSPLLDGGGATAWTALLPVPRAPYGKHLPAAGDERAAYAAGGLASTALLAAYTFDDAGDGAIADTTGAHPGTLIDGAGDGVAAGAAAGVVGAALEVGLADWVRVSGKLGEPAEPTVVLWLDPTSVGPDGAELLSIGENVGVDVHQPGAGSSTGGFYYGGAVAGWQGTYVSTPLTAGLWHHLAYVHRGGGDPLQRLLVEGREVAHEQYAAPIDYGDQGFADTYVGGHPTDARWQFAGRIDELSIWGRALATEEVMALRQRAVLHAGYQVRACAAPDCAGAEFVGPGGSTESWFSEASNATAGLPVFSLADLVAPARYLQLRVRLQTFDPAVAPTIDRINVRGTRR